MYSIKNIKRIFTFSEIMNVINKYEEEGNDLIKTKMLYPLIIDSVLVEKKMMFY